MNSIKLVIITTLLTLSVATAQADTTTPNILSSVSENSIQTLSNSEAGKVRGEYRECNWFGCTVWTSYDHLANYSNWFSFRKSLGRLYDLKGRKIYASR